MAGYVPQARTTQAHGWWLLLEGQCGAELGHIPVSRGQLSPAHPGGIRGTRRETLGSNGIRVVGVLRTRAVKGPFFFLNDELKSFSGFLNTEINLLLLN